MKIKKMKNKTNFLKKPFYLVHNVFFIIFVWDLAV